MCDPCDFYCGCNCCCPCRESYCYPSYSSQYTVIRYLPIPTPTPTPTPVPVTAPAYSVNIDSTPQTVATGTAFALNGVNTSGGTAITYTGNGITLNEPGTYWITSNATLATSSPNTAVPLQLTATNGDNRLFNAFYDSLSNNGTGTYTGAYVVNNAPVTLTVQNASGTDVTANRVELDAVKIA